MIAATGDSTRFLSYFLAFPKTYLAEITLGAETDTLDNTGNVITITPTPPISSHELKRVEREFTGAISQIPPLFSNIQVDGRRGHEIARMGETVAMQPRLVHVHALSLAMEFHSHAAENHSIAMEKHRQILMKCTVSSGTYIRALARDIAVALGTCGHLSALRRVSIGHFTVGEQPPQTEGGLISAQMTDFEALAFYGQVTVTESEANKFLHGLPFTPVAGDTGTGITRVLCGDRFIGLGRFSDNKLLVEKIYSTAPVTYSTR